MKISKATEKNINIAAKLLLKGGIVAFPTETVYGLGALANDKKAIKRIYEVKGRPKNNPLIVHVYDINQALSITKNIPIENTSVTAYYMNESWIYYDGFDNGRNVIDVINQLGMLWNCPKCKF